ncbi:MAG: HIT domain-containing protein [Nocardioides sp.]|uniref:HIT family protein n=1 Tax=Nocardioides sp. TaxID=35761 RepID=UPI00326524AA
MHASLGGSAVVVVTAMPLSKQARADLSDLLGDGYLVVDIKEAPSTANILLTPVVSGNLLGALRAEFPDARILYTELHDDGYGISFPGPVSRIAAKGPDGYFVAHALESLSPIVQSEARLQLSGSKQQTLLQLGGSTPEPVREPIASLEPAGYDCPFCRMQRGIFNEHNQPGDVVAVTDHAYARIAPKWWPGNPGAVLVIPREHHENLYGIPTHVGHAVWDLTQQVAIAMRRSYPCAGISTRQHNESAGNQDVWHLHVHVFPRTEGDDLYLRHREARWVGPDERMPYAEVLAAELRAPRDFG